MSQNTSSPKSYNVMALRGAPIDDMEYVEEFSLDPKLAYTPQINTAMLDMTYDQNIAAGIDEKEAMRLRKESENNIKHLLAKKGMLK